MISPYEANETSFYSEIAIYHADKPQTSTLYFITI